MHSIIASQWALKRTWDFLFSGDAYKTATPSPTQQKLLMRCFYAFIKQVFPLSLLWAITTIHSALVKQIV